MDFPIDFSLHCSRGFRPVLDYPPSNSLLYVATQISHQPSVEWVKTNSGFIVWPRWPSCGFLWRDINKFTNPFVENGLFVSPFGNDLFICYSIGECCLQHFHFIANHDAEPHQHLETVGDGVGPLADERGHSVTYWNEQLHSSPPGLGLSFRYSMKTSS